MSERDALLRELRDARDQRGLHILSPVSAQKIETAIRADTARQIEALRVELNEQGWPERVERLETMIALLGEPTPQAETYMTASAECPSGAEPPPAYDPCTHCGAPRNYAVDGVLQAVCYRCAHPDAEELPGIEATRVAQLHGLDKAAAPPSEAVPPHQHRCTFTYPSHDGKCRCYCGATGSFIHQWTGGTP